MLTVNTLYFKKLRYCLFGFCTKPAIFLLLFVIGTNAHSLPSSLELLTLNLQDDYLVSRKLSGRILPKNQAMLSFEIQGRINNFPSDIGDSVNAGDVLASLDNSEIYASYNQAVAQKKLSGLVLDRYKDLKKDGFVSSQEYDKAVAEYDIAASQVEFFKVKLRQSQLIAPFDGFIQQRFYDTGSMVNPMQPVLEIIDSKQVEAQVSIPLKYLDLLVPGELYEFELSNNVYQAKLERLSPMTNVGSGNRLAIFSFKEFIAPGEVTNLVLKTQISSRGAWVPLTALSQGNQGLWNIYSLIDNQDGSKSVVREIVSLEYTDGIYAFISGTIKTGDRVITGGASKVIEGQRFLNQ